MSTATLSGLVVSRMRMTIPAWGLWWADVDLVDESALSGSQVLTVAGVTHVCAVVSGGPFDGRSAYRLVGGAGGWGQSIAARGYANDLGVKKATIAGDAAASVGEALNAAPLGVETVGPHYARPEGPAIAALNYAAPRGWHVDREGVTQATLRPTTPYVGDRLPSEYDPATRVFEFIDDDVSQWLPGVQVPGYEPATDVELWLDAERLTVRLYAGETPSRRLQALARIFDALDPARRFRASHEYRVVTQSGERLNLQPVRVADGMPDLARVPVRPGTAGHKATVTPGELVVVQFLGGDPSRPVVTNHDAPDAPGWRPQKIEVDAATGIELGGTGNQPAAIASLVESAIATQIVGHTHSGVTTGPGTSGNGLAAAPTPSTAAQKVRIS